MQEDLFPPKDSTYNDKKKLITAYIVVVMRGRMNNIIARDDHFIDQTS